MEVADKSTTSVPPTQPKGSRERERYVHLSAVAFAYKVLRGCNRKDLPLADRLYHKFCEGISQFEYARFSESDTS